MLSDNTNELYSRLGHIAHEVEQALCSDDFHGIESLVTEHNDIINALSLSEKPVDENAKPAIELADKNIRALMSKIQDMQNDIKIQLSTMNKKKLIHSAYNV